MSVGAGPARPVCHLGTGAILQGVHSASFASSRKTVQKRFDLGTQCWTEVSKSQHTSDVCMGTDRFSSYLLLLSFPDHQIIDLVVNRKKKSVRKPNT